MLISKRLYVSNMHIFVGIIAFYIRQLILLACTCRAQFSRSALYSAKLLCNTLVGAQHSTLQRACSAQHSTLQHACSAPHSTLQHAFGDQHSCTHIKIFATELFITHLLRLAFYSFYTRVTFRTLK
jgi:hypothetical protein